MAKDLEIVKTGKSLVGGSSSFSGAAGKGMALTGVALGGAHLALWLIPFVGPAILAAWWVPIVLVGLGVLLWE